MDYAAYDYYDWVCAEGKCQICNVLTGGKFPFFQIILQRAEMVAFFLIKYIFPFMDWLIGKACCNPLLHENCFLPDACHNSPCLNSGECVEEFTPDGYPDFECICINGLTGKYCHLVDDFMPIDVQYQPTNGAKVANVVG